MEEHRLLNEEYSQIAQELIETEAVLLDIRRNDVTIIYLSSDKEKKSKGKFVCGECEKVPDKYKWAVPADFTITIYDPNCEGMTADQMRILILHELMHIGITEQGKFFVVPHDIEDFEYIIKEYGLHWAKKAGE